MEVECFSDYMALWIPRSHVEGLRQWLGRTLHLPGTWRTPGRLDPFLAKCGYFLHPDPNGDFIFRALYSACFVQKEKANYRLEIRIFQKRVRRLEQRDGYVMKCPMTTPSLGQVCVHCGPTFVQPPWLLSLQGELVASLEDASLMGLYVDINATSITIQSPRPDLLQRQEVLNTSTELLPLWLVSGYSAYSLEVTCPPVSSRSELEVLVHIPKQRLGLVKRGGYFKESLSLQFLRVHQSSTFTVTESRDFVVVSILAAEVLRVQQCQEGQGAPGTQAFYRVDLSLEFKEMATPVLWTVENFFRCVGSGTELPASAAMPRTAPSPESPGPETPPAGMPSAASSLFQTAGEDMAATEPIPREPDQASEEFQPLMRPSMTSPTKEASGSCHSPRGPQETSSIGEATGLPQKGSDLPQEGAGGHLDLWSPEPHQDTQVPGLTTLLGRVTPFTTPTVSTPKV
ncbi:uncharacterized protein C1orf127 homolog [Trichechus inunguis]